MDEVLAAVDLSGALTAIVPILVVAIGIALAFKGSTLGKRAVSKA